MKNFGLIESLVDMPSKNNPVWIVRWDARPLIVLDGEGNELPTEYYQWEERVYRNRKSKAEFKIIIDQYFNEGNQLRILSGYQWRGHAVWLSSENQFNYKAAFDRAEQTAGLSLPYRVKFGNDLEPDYHDFKDMDEFRNFYDGAMVFIQNTLKECWDNKDNFPYDLYNSFLLG